MRKLIKNIIHRTYRPILQWYLSKERTYTYGDIKLKVSPGVFHPGYFYSTEYLLNYILEEVRLPGQKVLELGCGTALISIVIAKKGADVLATDISTNALDNAKINAELNQVDLECIQSDLFERIPRDSFDCIIINPPYFKGYIQSERDYAWYCGANMEYFRRLFEQLPAYMNPSSRVYMVLSDECDIDSIKKYASEQELAFILINKKRKGIEWNYIYSFSLKGQ